MRVAALALVIAVGGCGRGPVAHPGRVDGDDAIVYVDAVVDAALWVDGIYVGAVADVARGIALEPGPHRLELHHDGYWSHYQELALTPAQRLRLPIELAPVLP
ncbi:MAG: hypothetical protein IPL61_16065 [Myxococcales bacterium]|nr:hypothetical protein [Myxococcales bacterium]